MGTLSILKVKDPAAPGGAVYIVVGTAYAGPIGHSVAEAWLLAYAEFAPR